VTLLGLNVVGPAVAAIGASDCERLTTGVLAQPVNATTSLAFAITAAFVMAMTRRARGDHRASLMLAGLLAAIGVGSLAFHGPQPAGARILHDLPIALTALFIVALNLHSLSPANPAGRARVRAVAAVGAAAVLLMLLVVAPDAGPVATAVLVGAAIVTEVAVLRSGPSSTAGGRRAIAALAIILAPAAGLFLLGRTTSPMCDPDALLQPHGLWHAVAALGLGLWWWQALGPGSHRRIRPAGRAAQGKAAARRSGSIRGAASAG
jgi:hypothetical protein